MPRRRKTSRRKKGRGTYRTNPLTGRRERVPGQGERRNFLTGEIEKDPFALNHTRRKSPRPRKPRKLSKAERQAQTYAVLLVGLGFLFYAVYNWVVNNIVLASIIGALSLIVLVLLIWKVSFVRKKLFGSFTKAFKIYGPVKDEQIHNLVSEIKSMDVQTVRDEEDFEKQLYQRLHAMGYPLEKQVNREGRRIDMVVNSSIAIELKIADRSKNIQDLIGQITVYKKYYGKIIVVILDYGRVKNLQEYIEYIRNIDSDNISIVVLNGDVRRRKKKEEYIMVKKSTGWE